MSRSKPCDKQPASQFRRHRWRFDPWVGKVPWRRAWQSTPTFLPGESHGAWQAAVHSVTQSWTRLKRLSTHTHAPWVRRSPLPQSLSPQTSDHRCEKALWMVQCHHTWNYFAVKIIEHQQWRTVLLNRECFHTANPLALLVGRCVIWR